MELTISDGEETFVLIAKQVTHGLFEGRIEQYMLGNIRIDAFARTQYNPETRYATAGECLLALMRVYLLPAIGVRV